MDRRHRQVDLTAPKPKAALNETWNVKLYAVGQQAKQPAFLFDIEVTDVCATDAPVKLPKGMKFADMFHGHNERIPVDGLRWGTETLTDLLVRFAGV